MGVPSLREATLELLESFKEQLGDVRYRRARHVIGENARVNAFANALARGDWDEAGVAMRGATPPCVTIMKFPARKWIPWFPSATAFLPHPPFTARA